MKAAVARSLMTLATCSLGDSRREWALAMESEFESAIEEGEPLAFAAGCLIAAWRETPRQAEGLLLLANYAFALGLILPMAVLQVGEVAGLPLLLTGSADGIPAGGFDSNPYLASRLGAAPMLLALWLLLGVAQLCLAWAVVERDWSRVVKAAALIGAATLTLVVLMGVLLLDMESIGIQAAAMGAELIILVLVARSHARLHSAPSFELISL